jgi:hypothetical protein
MVLLAAGVAFFLFTSVREAGLARTGVPTPGRVVAAVDPQGWDIFDSGRLVVRYSTPRGAYTRTVWLDDPAHARPPGAKVTVLYDRGAPGRMRLPDDSNLPAPFGTPLLVTGLAGAVLALAAIVRRARAYRNGRPLRRVRARRCPATREIVRRRPAQPAVVDPPGHDVPHPDVALRMPAAVISAGDGAGRPGAVAQQTVWCAGPPAPGSRTTTRCRCSRWPAAPPAANRPA